jgi:hypothetical protein
VDEEIDAYRADENRKVRVGFAHIIILSLLVQWYEMYLFRKLISGRYIAVAVYEYLSYNKP